MATTELPHDVNQVITFLVSKAKGYHRKLQAPEVQRFKSELMESPERWLPDRVSVQAFKRECLDAGLSAGDTEMLVAFLRKAQSGRL
jgi:hypothetical protein